MDEIPPDSPAIDSSISNCDTRNNEPTNPSYGRYCHIVKRPDFEGYGFNLHSEKIKPGQYIGKVDPNSPAEAAGLREGDQIIEVNGVNIGMETHKQVVQRIKAISNEVRLLLINPNTESVIDSKSLTNISEKNTLSNKINNNSTTNIKSDSTTSAALTKSIRIVPNLVESSTVAPENQNQKDFVTNINMVSTKSQSTNSNNPQIDVTDFDKSEKLIKGNNALHNGKSTELLTSDAATMVQSLDSNKPQNADNFQNNAENNKTGLNLNLTAAEMRAKLLAKKKFDPKNESVDLKKKFDIIQKL